MRLARAPGVRPHAVALARTGGVTVRLLRTMFGAAPWLATAYVLGSSALVGIGIARTVLAGAIVGALPLAAHDGVHEVGGRHLTMVLTLFGVSFAGATLLGALQHLAATQLGGRIDGAVRDRVARAVLGRPTLEAVEDSATLNRVSMAISAPDGSTLSGTAVNLISTLTRYAALPAYGAVLWRFSPLLGVTMILLVLASRRANNWIFRPWLTAFLESAPQFRRSEYIAELGYGGEAAKEIRVFGLGQWLIERFHDERRPAVAGLFEALTRAQSKLGVRQAVQVTLPADLLRLRGRA